MLGFGAIASQIPLAFSSQKRWIDAQPYPFPIQEIYPALFNGEIYLAGGFAKSKEATFYGLAPSSELFIYNPDKDQWRKGPDLPESRHHLGMASNSSYLYGIGGFTGDKSNPWQSQRSVFKLSAQKSDQPVAWQTSKPLPIPLAESVYATIGENIHVIAGKSPKDSIKQDINRRSHFIFVDNKYWEKAAPPTIERSSAACATVNDKIYVVGGRQVNKQITNLDVFEVYDAKSDRWQSLRPLPVAVAGLTASYINGRIIVTGGEAFGPKGNWKLGKAYQQVWAYDINKDQWQEEIPMPLPRHGHGAIVIKDQLYLIGGAAKVGPQDTMASMVKIRF